MRTRVRNAALCVALAATAVGAAAGAQSGGNSGFVTDPQSGVTAVQRGTIHVTCATPNAEVYLDGDLVGTAPTDVPDVTTGEHTIELRTPGRESVRRTVSVTANAVVAVDAPELPLPGQAPAVTPPAGPGFTPPATVDPPEPVAAPPPAVPTRNVAHPLGPVLIGAGGGVALLGFIFWGVSEANYASLQRRCADGCSLSSTTGPRNSITMLDTLGNVMVFGGLGAAVAGVVLTFTLRREVPLNGPTLAINPGLGTVGIAGRF